MKVFYDVNARCRVEVELKDVTQAFEFLSYCDQTLGQKRCGHCESDNLEFRYRLTKEGYKYYSVGCRECGYELKFGISQKDGRLFPKGWHPPFTNDDNSAQVGSSPGCNEAPF